jgi:CRISPR-associated protein Cmr2
VSRALLQIAIGPVQDFIAAARRTRDLWFGSCLLSEISKAAAGAVRDGGGRLIFPDSGNLADDLKPGSDFNVANVILAEVESENAGGISAAAKKAAEDRWVTFVDEAYRILKEHVDPGEWDRQKKAGFIEFYSAWRPFDDGSYKQARREVARLLAARKNLRDFTPWKGTAKVPKCSLDGLRESVLRRDHRWKAPEPQSQREANAHESGRRLGLMQRIPFLRKRRENSGLREETTTPGNDTGYISEDICVYGVRIKKGESLDLVGCVRRAAGGRAIFPSVTRVALDSWIRVCEENEETRLLLKNLNPHCEKLKQLGVLSRFEELKKPGVLSRFEASSFPYEGTALLPRRYDEFMENVRDPVTMATIKTATEAMEQIMAALHRRHKPAEPYLAILCADGDKMGEAISRLDNPDRHREFSRALSRFAEEARKIVTGHRGACIYTGGDDVLAFLPVDKAPGCARALYDAFGSVGQTIAVEDPTQRLTLSVGIAVGHALEDLEILLGFGREAEKLAKAASSGRDDARNGLAVTVRARGNSEIFIREQWRARRALDSPLHEMSPDERLLFWADCFAKRRIPSKFPYELRSAAVLYEEWKNPETLDRAMQADVLRIFSRKDLRLESDEARVRAYIREVIKRSHKSIERLADELLVAQWIGAARAVGGN